MAESHSKDCEEDLELIRLAGDRDEGAWAVLWKRYSERLLRAVQGRLLRWGLNVDMAHDIVQTAWLGAWPRIPQFLEYLAKNPGARFEPWIRRIAIDRAVEAYRRHRPWVSLFEERSGSPLAGMLATSLTSASKVLDRKEKIALIQALMQELDEKDRDVLTMRHWDDMKFEEIADVLGMKIDAIAKRYYRALKKLRKRLEEDQGGGTGNG